MDEETQRAVRVLLKNWMSLAQRGQVLAKPSADVGAAMLTLGFMPWQRNAVTHDERAAAGRLYAADQPGGAPPTSDADSAGEDNDLPAGNAQ